MQINLLELKTNIDNLKYDHEEFKDITKRLIELNETESVRLRQETSEINAENQRIREANKVSVELESPIEYDKPLTAQQVYELFRENNGQQIINKLSPPSTTVTDSQKILKIASDPELWQQHLTRISEQLS